MEGVQIRALDCRKVCLVGLELGADRNWGMAGGLQSQGQALPPCAPHGNAPLVSRILTAFQQRSSASEVHF
jgi:hypothetical protein